MQYTNKDGVVFRIKPVNKADDNVINRPLIDSTSNVTVDSRKQSTIGDSVLMYTSRLPTSRSICKVKWLALYQLLYTCTYI